MRLARLGKARTHKQRADREIEADGRRLLVKVTEMPVARRMTLRLSPGGGELRLTVPASCRQFGS